MKRLIASFAGLGLLAGPAVAATTAASTTTVPKTAKHMKKNAKLAQKNAVHNAKSAAAPKTN
jgi:hypothetical protein